MSAGPELAKCACGAIMPEREWDGHRRRCRRSYALPVTAEDRRFFEEHERKRKEGTGK